MVPLKAMLGIELIQLHSTTRNICKREPGLKGCSYLGFLGPTDRRGRTGGGAGRPGGIWAIAGGTTRVGTVGKGTAGVGMTRGVTARFFFFLTVGVGTTGAQRGQQDGVQHWGSQQRGLG